MQKVEFIGDSPLARFGHTITPINKDKAILFGGAVGDTGKYVITGDTFLCDYNLKKWKKLQNHGMPPSNRAAHSSLSVDHFFYVFGGALGGGQLADDNLYQLDFLTLTDKAYWAIKNCKGSSPGARYGHVMAYLKPYVIIYGGNTGSEAVGDIWKMDIMGNCVWQKVNAGMQAPPPRVYHSASICRTGTASGMMVIFGGRGSDGIPMNDAWGLRKHRDGRLDWMKAPYRNNSKPAERYQHKSIFVGQLLMIIGGRNNQVGQSTPLDIYDTDSSDWYRISSIDRFRHCCFMIQHNIFIHGGFDQEAPNVPTDSIIKMDLNKLFSSFPALYKGLAYEIDKDIINHPGLKRGGSIKSPQSIRQSTASEKMRQQMIPQSSISRRNIHTSNFGIKLSPQAVVMGFNEQQEMKKIHIDMLPTEHRRLVGNTSVGNPKEHLEKIHRFFLNSLFCRPLAHISYPLPGQYIDKLLETMEKILDNQPTMVRMRLPVKVFGDIHGQIQQLNRFFEAFKAPHDEQPNGDIEVANYLFLGDYVDRGTKSLQTILLLFSLKIKYPENIVLLRGSHQDKVVNKHMGFGDECASKLKENIDDQFSFFNRCNRIFEKLPIAALIEDNIFCCHGGVGQSLKFVAEVQKIEKPIRVNYEPKSKNDKIVYELLWSDPCRGSEPDFAPNTEHDYFKTKSNPKFSEDRSNIFCNENNLITIIRSNEPMYEGFEIKDSLITVFSCSDYGGANNNSAIIHVLKNEDILPKLLNPSGGKDRWHNLEDYHKKGEDQFLRKMNFTPPKK